MRGLFLGLVTEIERLSLEFSLVAWHTAGTVHGWSHCRIAGSDAVEVAVRTGHGDVTLTILPRGERWCVYQGQDALLVEDRFPRMVNALRLLMDRGEGSSLAIH